ncbi:MAG: hypothetical protein IJ461_00915 [Clostridia bacterium]|nr:hypothetical protein [Clostridia bacterium]
MPREWMIRLREEKGMSLNDAAKACSVPDATVTVQLLEYLESWDSWTLAVFTHRIAQVYGMTPEQEKEITKDFVYDRDLEGIRLRAAPPSRRPKAAAKLQTPTKHKINAAPWRLNVPEVTRRLAALGLSMREVSRSTGRAADWLNKLLRNAADGKTVQTATAQTIAQALACDVSQIVMKAKEEEHELLS